MFVLNKPNEPNEPSEPNLSKPDKKNPWEKIQTDCAKSGSNLVKYRGNQIKLLKKQRKAQVVANNKKEKPNTT